MGFSFNNTATHVFDYRNHYNFPTPAGNLVYLWVGRYQSVSVTVGRRNARVAWSAARVAAPNGIEFSAYRKPRLWPFGERTRGCFPGPMGSVEKGYPFPCCVVYCVEHKRPVYWFKSPLD